MSKADTQAAYDQGRCDGIGEGAQMMRAEACNLLQLRRDAVLKARLRMGALESAILSALVDYLDEMVDLIQSIEVTP